MAVRAGDVAKVESLIQDGANVNCMNTMYYDYHDESSHQYYSWSPLYHAVDAGKAKLKLKNICLGIIFVRYPILQKMKR